MDYGKDLIDISEMGKCAASNNVGFDNDWIDVKDVLRDNSKGVGFLNGLMIMVFARMGFWVSEYYNWFLGSGDFHVSNTNRKDMQN